MRLISEKFRQKQENDTSTNVSDATSGVGDQLLEYHLLFTERAILRMHAKKMCQTSVEVDFHPLGGECSPSLDHEGPVTVQDNVGSRQPISLYLSEKTLSTKDDEEVAGNSVQFRGNRGYFDKHYLSVTVPTPLTLTARSIMVQELAVAGIRISAIHRYSEIGRGNRVVRFLTSILLFAPAPIPIPSPSAEPLPCSALTAPSSTASCFRLVAFFFLFPLPVLKFFL